MDGPVPWPDDPAFGRWAARRGIGNVGGHVGYVSQFAAASPVTGTMH